MGAPFSTNNENPRQAVRLNCEMSDPTVLKNEACIYCHLPSDMGLGTMSTVTSGNIRGTTILVAGAKSSSSSVTRSLEQNFLNKFGEIVVQADGL